MQSYKTTEPIFANITSIFGSAVIVVRLSSAEFEDIIKACLALEILPEKLKHKQVFLTKITKNGEFLDESLVTFLQGSSALKLHYMEAVLFLKSWGRF